MTHVFCVELLVATKHLDLVISWTALFTSPVALPTSWTWLIATDRTPRRRRHSSKYVLHVPRYECTFLMCTHPVCMYACVY